MLECGRGVNGTLYMYFCQKLPLGLALFCGRVGKYPLPLSNADEQGLAEGRKGVTTKLVVEQKKPATTIRDNPITIRDNRITTDVTRYYMKRGLTPTAA